MATGGGSDANIFNAKGLPTVVLGVGFEAIHSLSREYADKELISWRRWCSRSLQRAGPDLREGFSVLLRV